MDLFIGEFSHFKCVVQECLINHSILNYTRLIYLRLIYAQFLTFTFDRNIYLSQYLVVKMEYRQLQGHTMKHTHKQKQHKAHSVTRPKSKQRDQSAAVIGKEAPFIITRLLHLVQMPHIHNSAAQRIAKERQALTHPITMCRVSPILQSKSHPLC